MSRIKRFDLHIEVGYESGKHYARCIFGNNTIEFEQQHASVVDAIQMLLSDLTINGVFGSLTKDPTYSVYPIPNSPPVGLPSSAHQHGHPNTGPGHTHSYGNQVTHVASRTKMYELHIEVGKFSTNSKVYARTELVQPPQEWIVINGVSMELAIGELFVDMEAASVFMHLTNLPTMSIFPFASISYSPSGVSSTSSSSSTPPTAKKKDGPRKLPNDCISDSHPGCQDVCTAFDHFGTTKCHSICAWRKGI